MADMVTVALLGKVDRAFENDAFTWHETGAEELDVPWEALPRIELEVEDGDTIYDILARALSESGIRLPHFVDPEHPVISWVMFRQAEVQPGQKCFHHV
jgi:hypothetical protein